MILKIIHIVLGIIIGIAVLVAAEDWRKEERMISPNLFALIVFAILEIVIIKSY